MGDNPAGSGVKCVLHVDKLITAGGSWPETPLPDAVTWAPVMQNFTVGGIQIPAALTLPVCFDCRRDLLGKAPRVNRIVEGTVIPRPGIGPGKF